MEDQPKEEASASAELNSSKVTKAQLDKFKELQKRLLEIKEVSKKREKSKGNRRKVDKICNLNLVTEDAEGIVAVENLEDSNLYIAEGSTCSVETTPTCAMKKKRKLHWGLDTKERWERKANM